MSNPHAVALRTTIVLVSLVAPTVPTGVEGAAPAAPGLRVVLQAATLSVGKSAPADAADPDDRVLVRSACDNG